MALKIRLARGGAKKRPFYRIVVADSRAPLKGRFVQKIGYFDPLLDKTDERALHLDADRAKYWISQGAKPSDRVARFLDKAGLWTRPTRKNPQKAVPKTKAQERLKAKEDAEKEATLAAKEAAKAEKEAVKEAKKEAATATKEDAKPEQEAAKPEQEAKKEDATATKEEAVKEDSEESKKADA